MGIKVLFFGDIGIDDAVALIYAQLTGTIDLVGIVADYGNVPRDMTMRNANYLLNVLNKKDVVVIKGAERPMTGETPGFFPGVHGIHGLGPIIPPFEPTSQENFCAVIDIIVNTGRLTSLATTFLLYGDLMKHIKAYYIMGGAFMVPGNVTPVAEANFFADPYAVNIVTRYATNVTLFPLNVTNRAIVTPEMVNYIHTKGKTTLVKPLLDFYYHAYQKFDPSIQGSPVHDVLSFIAVIHDEMFTYVASPVQIEVNQDITRGQSIADFRASPTISGERIIERIAIDFNYPQFYKHFMSAMTGESF